MTTLTFVVFYPVITCPPASPSAHSAINTTLATFGTNVLYECELGFWFKEAKSYKKMTTCKDDHHWSNTVPDCEGKKQDFMYQ